ncbi:MAG: NAD(P)/FAD-dependent oxidoreductase [Flavobacteriaceae bacterium]|nr:NAD(P)/FAD-dependent oxidoreductase [Flavobacteriaceae bacterium]
MKKKSTIVIVGGGFAGLELINKLDKSNAFNIVLVDTNNYNFFPPLIYQVAAGFMEPSAISYPFRKILRKKKNVRFWLGNLEKVIPSKQQIVLSNGTLNYDILVMSTGVETNYFGNKNIEALSLPMKSISDALSLRNVIFTRLERATRLKSTTERKKLLTYVIAGAGPTGVELSGIFAEMQLHIIQKDYPELSPEDLGKIYLIDGQDTVLAPMSKKSQEYTFEKLTELHVEIKLNTLVKDFKDEIVYLSDGSKIHTKNLIWAAGITARTFEGFEPTCHGPGKRFKTDVYNLIEGYDTIYALGDCSIITGDENAPKGHPQVAQVAIQQAQNLGANLLLEKEAWKPFQYTDKGSLAIIGRNKAVLDTPRQQHHMNGFFAWFVWIFVHIMSLVNFRNKLRAVYDWTGYYIYKDQSFRMIIKPRERNQQPSK